MEHQHSLLSGPAILKSLGKGIIIHPFNPKLLNGGSYDMRLGPNFFRMRGAKETGDYITNPYRSDVVERRYGNAILAPTVEELRVFLWNLRKRLPWRASSISIDPYEQKVLAEIVGFQRLRLCQLLIDSFSLVKCWGGDKSAATLGQKADHLLEQLVGFREEDRVIILRPGEMILGHTMEHIGGTKDPETGRCFTAEMKARSSVGRHGIEICRCAGLGDPGYILIWTMEINNTTDSITFLLVGTPVAQMMFYEVDPVPDEMLYGSDANRDHYQTSLVLKHNIATWHPGMLVPKPLKIWRPDKPEEAQSLALI